MREEDKEWDRLLTTIIEQLVGMKRLFLGWQEESFFILLCKLEGLLELKNQQDFFIYRKTIFQCLSLLGEMKTNV